MRRSIILTISMLAAVALVLSLAGTAWAQEQPAPAKPQVDRLSGTVQNISKDTKTFTVRTRNNVMRQIVYSDATKVTNNNKPGGSIDEIKEGTRIIALGKFNAKTQLEAERIDIRPPR